MVDNKFERNILIGGASYGLHNIGDEAILRSIIYSFKDVANLSILTFGSEWVNDLDIKVDRFQVVTFYDKPILGLTATPRRKIINSIKNSFFPDLTAYKGQNLFICGGGTILSDCPWHALHLVEQAAKCNVPTILWGVGMADVKDSSTLQYIKEVCNSDYVRHIYTRDEFVKERLVKCNVLDNKISVCYDPAYILRPSKLSIETFLNKRALTLLKDTRPKICISLSGEPDVTNRSHIEEIRKFIDIASEQISIFLIPTGFDVKCQDKEILKSFESNSNTVLIENELSPEELISVLSYMDLIISSRLHCSIFGADVGVPSINLVRNAKQIDFSKLFELPYIYMRDVDSEKMIFLSQSIIKNKEIYRERILSKLSLIKNQYIDSCEHVKRNYI